jgi:hypothetical protein
MVNIDVKFTEADGVLILVGCNDYKQQPSCKGNNACYDKNFFKDVKKLFHGF